MVMFFSKDGQCEYEIWWLKDGQIKFNKRCINIDLESYNSWPEYLQAHTSAMKEWSEKRAQQENFKVDIVAVLEKIAGSKHNSDDIRFVMSKAIWKKLKADDVSKNDFSEYTTKK